MMVEVIVGLDTGRNEVKAIAKSQQLSFPSAIGIHRELKMERELAESDMILVYEGKKYYVGSIAEIESHDGTKNFLKSKAHADTKLLGLVAIHRLVQTGDHVHLVICHPIENHKGQDKAKLKEMFIGEHQVTLNGLTKQIIVESVSVTSECACALFAIDGIPTLAHGLDIGSATVNYATWYKGNWVDRLSGTLPYGAENSNLSVDRLARKVAIDFSKMVQEVKGNVYLFGGLHEVIAPYLVDYITGHRVISVPDGKFVNAKACYNMGEKLYAKRQTQNV